MTDFGLNRVIIEKPAELEVHVLSPHPPISIYNKS